MKPKELSSRRPFDPADSAPDFLGPIAPEVTSPLKPLTFPTVQEILEHQAGTTLHPLMQLSEIKPPSRPQTLFEGLLGGDLNVLVQDARSNQDRYDERTRAFLEELVTGQHDIKSLPPEQADMLSHAVMDFASVRPKKKPTPRTNSASRAHNEKKPALMIEAGLPDERAPQVPLPDGALPPYWWVGG